MGLRGVTGDPKSKAELMSLSSSLGQGQKASSCCLLISPLGWQCESIVEEHEDELIEFFSREADNIKDKLCSKRTDLCDHALHISHDEL